jgi:uncharacterized protein (UPF0264 family)
MDDVEQDGNDGGSAGDARIVRTECDWSVTAPSTVLVEAIAAVEDVDPVDQAADGGDPLYEHVDPDALDSLVTDQRPNGLTMALNVNGYGVRITDTELIVEPTANAHDEDH